MQIPPLCGKRAVITGITGQDGSYLAELLLAQGYEIWGLVRRTSSHNTWRLDALLQDRRIGGKRLHLRLGDITDDSAMRRLLAQTQPHEVYNLAAQSDVKVSFELPVYTAEVTGLGPVRILEIVRQLELPCRFYQASSSELFGRARQVPQTENTPFHPRSPYAAAKAYAFHITRNYREAYGMYAVNGILFNHESPRRGAGFVTRKITLAAARIKQGLQQSLSLGNLDAQRDWGFAGDYVLAMWQMLQLDQPDDFVIATGKTHTVRHFCEGAFARAGLPLRWEGEGPRERGLGPDGRELVNIDPDFRRPSEVDRLCGDASKAKAAFGWEARVSCDELIGMMTDADLELVAAGGAPAEEPSHGGSPEKR